jgi:alpha-1,2-glucosyltransferase
VFTWIPIYLLARQRQQGISSSGQQHAAHTALNIALFPPLFFFIALYYTDVVSTEVVLWALWFRQNETLRKMPFARALIVIFVGVVALLFRQTNVFWVGVFTTGLDVVDTLRSATASLSKTSSEQTFKKPVKSLPDVISKSWTGQAVYDVPVHEACFEGMTISMFLGGRSS